MLYRIREKLAYSAIGKKLCTVLRDKKYPNERVHWVQQRFAEWRLASA